MANYVTYLGADFEERLIFKDHFAKLITRLNILIKALYLLIVRKSKLKSIIKIAIA